MKGTTMIWTRVKDRKQLVLDGISIEADKSDSSLRSVTFTDGAGHKVRVLIDSYTLYVEVPAPPKMVEKFEVSGVIAGVPVTEQFDDSYSADNRKRELESHDAEVAIATVSVEQDIPF
jgi:hypothetical protein